MSEEKLLFKLWYLIDVEALYKFWIEVPSKTSLEVQWLRASNAEACGFSPWWASSHKPCGKPKINEKGIRTKIFKKSKKKLADVSFTVLYHQMLLVRRTMAFVYGLGFIFNLEVSKGFLLSLLF